MSEESVLVFTYIKLPVTTKSADALNYTASTCKYLLAICAFPIASTPVVAPKIAAHAGYLEVFYLADLAVFALLSAFYLWRVVYLTALVGRIHWSVARIGEDKTSIRVVAVSPVISMFIDALKYVGLFLLVAIAAMLVSKEI